MLVEVELDVLPCSDPVTAGVGAFSKVVHLHLGTPVALKLDGPRAALLNHESAVLNSVVVHATDLP